jgi:hypothetical protein
MNILVQANKHKVTNELIGKETHLRRYLRAADRALRLRLSRASSCHRRRLTSSTTPARAASRANRRRSSSPSTSSSPASASALWYLGLAAGGAESATVAAGGGRRGKEIAARDLARRGEESAVETTPAATGLAAAVAMARLPPLPAGDGRITHGGGDLHEDSVTVVGRSLAGGPDPVSFLGAVTGFSFSSWPSMRRLELSVKKPSTL